MRIADDTNVVYALLMMYDLLISIVRYTVKDVCVVELEFSKSINPLKTNRICVI